LTATRVSGTSKPIENALVQITARNGGSSG
jgi:hypothetical protein